MPRRRGALRPVGVHRDGGAWSWRCRLRWCHRSGTRRRWDRAVEDALAHLDDHARFGFGR